MCECFVTKVKEEGKKREPDAEAPEDTVRESLFLRAETSETSGIPFSTQKPSTHPGDGT